MRVGSRNTTGSESRIAARRRPYARSGEEGITTRRPGIWASMALGGLRVMLGGAARRRRYREHRHRRPVSELRDLVYTWAGVFFSRPALQSAQGCEDILQARIGVPAGVREHIIKYTICDFEAQRAVA